MNDTGIGAAALNFAVAPAADAPRAVDVDLVRLLNVWLSLVLNDCG